MSQAEQLADSMTTLAQTGKPTHPVARTGERDRLANVFAFSLAVAGGMESVKTYKLLQALRSGDAATITPLLAFYPSGSNTRRGSSTAESSPASPEQQQLTSLSVSTPLHLAVRCAKYPTVQLVLRHAPLTVNARDAKGQTPLHIAASLNRLDVVSLFLNEPSVDDMIRDAGGKTCLDLAPGPEASKLISCACVPFSSIERV